MIVREGVLTAVVNYSFPWQFNGIFTVTMDPGGGFHIRSLGDGPSHADLVACAEELHRHHFETRSARPR